MMIDSPYAIWEKLKNQKSFEIELNNFGNFEPRVLFIDVDENEALNSLQHSIEIFMKQFQVFNGTHS